MASPTSEKRSLTELYGVELYAPTDAPLLRQMERLTERMGGSFYVLPYTRVQMLLCREDRLDSAYLERIASSCCYYTKIPNGRLGRTLYHYDAEAHRFELASIYKERRWGMKRIKKGCD